MTLILFLILVVLVYAVGLLPGVMKLIAGVVMLVGLSFSASLYGWATVFGAFFAAIVTAATVFWLIDFSRPAQRNEAGRSAMNAELDKINAEQGRRRR